MDRHGDRNIVVSEKKRGRNMAEREKREKNVRQGGSEGRMERDEFRCWKEGEWLRVFNLRERGYRHMNPD